MKRCALNCTIILFFVIGILVSCKKDIEAPSNDTGALREFMTIPFNPVATTWSFDKSNDRVIAMGPTDYDITAVFTLSPADFDSVKNVFSHKQATSQLLTLASAEGWFPESVMKHFKNKGDHYEVTGLYEPDLFFKSPFLNGYCLFTDDNKILVHLFTN